MSNILLRKIFKILVEVAARLGISRSYFLDEFNNFAGFGRFLRNNRPPVSFEDRYELYEYLNRQALDNKCIDYLEFGVYKGDSIGKWAEINTNENSRFFGFDSFEGLGETYKYTFLRSSPTSMFSTGGKTPDIADKRVQFVKGYFQDSLPGFLDDFKKKGDFLVIHLDADLYTSTLFVLASLNDLIGPQTLLVFDEFFSVNNEFRAFIDYSRSFMKKFKVLAATKYYKELAMEIY